MAVLKLKILNYNKDALNNDYTVNVIVRFLDTKSRFHFNLLYKHQKQVRLYVQNQTYIGFPMSYHL